MTQIREAVVNQGRLTKNEIIYNTFNVAPDRYPDVRDSALKAFFEGTQIWAKENWRA